MDYNSYYHELLADIREARESWVFDQRAFLATACEMLKDCNAIVDFEPSYLREREGTRTFMAIDGYDQAAFDQDESIVIIACDDGFTDRLGNEPPVAPTIIAKECNRYITGMRNFVKSARSGDFLKNHEESRPEYGLASFIHENRDRIARYRLYFLTDRLYTGREASLTSTQNVTSDVYGKNSNIEAHVWDLRRFHDAARAFAPQEQLSIDLTQYVADGIQAIRSPGQTEDFATYLMFFTGDVLADLYEKYGAKLMEANVRSFLSARGKVNKGIRNTLQNNPDHFVAFNNGITATTTGMKLSSSGNGTAGPFLVERIDNLQIVNGGQTTASIFYACKKDKATLKNVVVPAKVVLIEDINVANALIPDISRFTNSQNKVAEADLSSNSDFQRQLEKVSQQVLAPSQPGVLYQTHWYYERTRGQYESEKNRFSGAAKTMFSKCNPKGQIIKMVDGAKYLLSWERQPDIVSLGGQKCFAVFARQMSDIAENELERIDADYYRCLVAKKILFDTARLHFMTKSTWYKKAFLANITTYAVAKIAEDCRKVGKTLDFNRIWQEQSISGSLMATIDEAGRQASEVLNDESRPTQNITEWAKKKGCWQVLQDYPTCIRGISALIIDNKIKRPRHAAQPKHDALIVETAHHSDSGMKTEDKVRTANTTASQVTSSPKFHAIPPIQNLPREHSDDDLDRILQLPSADKLQWMLSLPSTKWQQLRDFARSRSILSPKAESSLEQLINTGPHNSEDNDLINVNAMTYLIQRAAQLGFHIQRE